MSFVSDPAGPPPQRLSVAEFLAWSETQEGRYELVDGRVYAQAAERVAHTKMKGLVFLALAEAIKKRGLDCRALVDGAAVRVGARSVFEPDALIYCGPELPPDATLVENPVVVVEVISPSTGRNDTTRKLAGYFNLPSIQHYLMIDPDERLVVHAERGADGVVRTHFFKGGVVKMDPPGLELPLEEIYGTG
ncbi:MAG TPA: Uma2 family endonuclease [Methylocystis sp.]|nr:Uma2 family endonuclease [Methylocystis sp.]